MRRVLALVLSLVSLLAVAGGSHWLAPAARSQQSQLNVVTTVAPLANIVLNVGGSRINLSKIIPDGTDSHTFEPSPTDARVISQADLIVANGLSLEGTTIKLAAANKKPAAPILLLGENTIDRSQWIFDFSFPEADGEPNPHLWMNPVYAMRYAELVRDQLVALDQANAAYYADNTDRFLARLRALDGAINTAVQTIPVKNRKLLTYHDSFAYFAPRYGMTVIGAVQPSDFAEPSPQELAALIEQLKAEGVPAIFGSEVFPSRVLDQIAREAGGTYVDTLRDDDLPGPPESAGHTYVGMLVEDVTTIARALGGDPSAMQAIDSANTFQP